MSTGSSRRDLLKHIAAIAAAAGTARSLGQETRPTTAVSRLGIGFIGCGGRAGNHMQAVQWLKQEKKYPLEIVAACDVYRPRLQKVVENFRCKAYSNHKDLLADPAVDIVCIATPDHHHGYQAIDAVRAGKHVYCEKPVTHWKQFDLIKNLAAEVKKSGRVFQLGTQGMSDWAWHQARKLIADGLIGQPIHAECGYFRVGDWGERGMPIDNPNAKPGSELDWDAFLGDAPKRPFDISRFFRWRMYEDYAGGPCTDLFPHSYTPMVFMLGVNFPSMVVATGGIFRYPEREVPDTFNMLVDYPQKMTVAILGTQGNNDPGVPTRGAAGRVPVIRGWEGSLTFTPKEIVFTPAEGSKKQKQTFPIQHGEDFILHWESFLNCCREKNPATFSPVELAYHTQTALIMGYWSLKQGKVARFDDQRQRIVMG